ncbi:MAG TPA: M48 family metalloprotease [Gemmataceae bacterium]|nr:M48 family metalloprotease [Gemmataceae bacterium]
MRTPWRGAFCLVVGLTGCIGDGSDREPFAFRNPFKEERRFDPSSAPVASARAATRVHAVGSAVVAANSADLPSKPAFLTVGLKEPMAFHQAGQVVVSEGLVDRCASDAELAAVVSNELGKIAAARAEKGPLRAERDLPPAGPVPNDVVGASGPPDMTRAAEEAMFDRRGTRPGRNAREPGPDPKTLAHNFFVKAGHSADDFDRAAGLIKEAEENAEKRELMRGR